MPGAGLPSTGHRAPRTQQRGHAHSGRSVGTLWPGEGHGRHGAPGVPSASASRRRHGTAPCPEDPSGGLPGLAAFFSPSRSDSWMLRLFHFHFCLLSCIPLRFIYLGFSSRSCALQCIFNLQPPPGIYTLSFML